MNKMKNIFLSTILLSIAYCANAQYTKLLNFANDTTYGRFPSGSLFSDGTFLYGTTTGGGTTDNGTIFKIKPDGTEYTKLFDFTGENGSSPNGTLVSDATYLYGMTMSGGTSLNGTIFKIKFDGNDFSKLLDFDYNTNGSDPSGSLIFDGTFLYGMTLTGGSISGAAGTVFKIKTDGTNYSTLLNFTGENGSSPMGSLIGDQTFLYGMTRGGGTGSCNNMCGVIFKIKADGTEYAKLLDFTGENGSQPEAELISDGTFLYGTTSHGGANDWGVVFKIKPDGTGYSKLHDFDATSESLPCGSLVSDGTFLYGTTLWGSGGSGTIFKIKPDGTEYSNLFDFTDTTGFYPKGSLTSDNTFLYGSTPVGGSGCSNPHGPSGCGVIFKYQISTSTDMVGKNIETSSIISPNPSSGIFTIGLSNGLDVHISAYDVLGNCLLNKVCRNERNPKIDLSNQPKGVYFLKIISDGERAVKKIVLQ